jgi:hypothetical protein
MAYKFAARVLLALFFVGCVSKDKGFHGSPVEPSIAGTWIGTINVDDVPTAATLLLRQQGLDVKGTYTADGHSTILAHGGSIQGATTGPTFSLNVTVSSPTCPMTVQMGGQNDGATLTLNVIGTDCTGATLRGQATLTKQ